MIPQVKSIRPFIGANDFDISRQFYREIGFTETPLDKTMSVFRMGTFSFYLQKYSVKDWIDNTMVFLEVEEPEKYLDYLKSLNLDSTNSQVRISKMVYNDWGNEFFLHDPSNILWHIGSFKS